ncbi:conserved domain protein [Cyanobium sp. PCC 7001]|uniref:META domain-containing protein n=1 Tax=Cyanobium sp. PCC 7001 TaxID=180281 RepID=UPI0001805C37|nr:META domain-containing protein [Cyanobium sp. PCC 7001]EDY38948.1 conserved domain protein [Cyanobium sp. PCC 7001]
MGQPPAPAQEPGPINLATTHWQLLEIQSMDDAIGSRRPENPRLYTLELGADGRASLRLNCNRATGTWTAMPAGDGSSGSFRFSPLAMTRALCPPPSLDSELGRDLALVRGYRLLGDRLALSLFGDGGILVWQRLEGGPRNWRVTAQTGALRRVPSATGSVAARYPAGTLLDNLGCGKGPAGLWCDVQRLGGGPRGYLLGNDLEAAISPDGTVHYGEDDSALRAGQGDFDASGELPCRLESGQASDQPTGRCGFQVARAGGGYATVVISLPDGRERTVYFRMGQAIGNAVSEADRTGPFQASREGDLTRVRIGDERYEIPDAVVLGG